MKIIYERDALKALNCIPEGDRLALRRKLRIYAETGSGDIIKLVGRKGWSLRHGDWRAIFVVHHDMIVIQIAHHREVYG